MSVDKLVGCLPTLSSSGDMYLSEDIEVIIQSIFVILVTPKGSRPWQPEFGSNLLDYLYDLNTPDTNDNIKSEVRSALDRWEPRINIIDIVVTSEGNTGAVSVNIQINFTYDDRTYEHTFPLKTDLDMMDLTIYPMMMKRA